MNYVRFKHARFSARLPEEFRYSLSHYWMSPDPVEEGTWRVGFTKFATRMLGELVEARYEVDTGSAVSSGQQIGYVEGFKAASDVFCVMSGEFLRGNPALDVDALKPSTQPI